MAQVKVIGSSSQGNCYLLTAGGKTLILEAGLPLKEVKRAMGYKIGSVVGALVTHEHHDHASYVQEYCKAGIKVYGLEEASEPNPLYKAVKPMQRFVVDGFVVMTLPASHDVPCLAYIVNHAEFGSLLFLTDSFKFGYRIEGINHLLIECNYADDILDKNIESGRINVAMRKRLMTTHMELETTKRTISRLAGQLETIVLCHLSDGNSDAERFRNEVEAVAGVPTYVADKGVKIELNY